MQYIWVEFSPRIWCRLLQFIGVYCNAFPPGERALRICNTRTKIHQSLCAELKLCLIYSSGKGNSMEFLPGRGFLFSQHMFACALLYCNITLSSLFYLLSGCIAMHCVAISSPLLAFHDKFPFPLFLLPPTPSFKDWNIHFYNLYFTIKIDQQKSQNCKFTFPFLLQWSRPAWPP